MLQQKDQSPLLYHNRLLHHIVQLLYVVTSRFVELTSHDPQAAAWSLHQEADKFVSEGNSIISTAKEMSDHMRQLAEYTRVCGHIEVCMYE